MPELIAFVFRLILGLLFTITGLMKLPNTNGFYVILLTYNMFPKWFARISSYILPVAETLIGLWLLSGKYPLYASIATLVMLASATGIVFCALVQQKKIENCGCYGTAIKVPVTWKKMVENIVWMGMTVVLLLSS